LKRIFQVVAIFIAAIIAAGVTGFSFYVWPTDISDKNLTITPAMLEQFQSCRRNENSMPI
jgi:hypothetical protein